MYTDKRKFLYGIILILIAICCAGCLISGRTGNFYYVGIVVSLFAGIAFLRNSRI